MNYIHSTPDCAFVNALLFTLSKLSYYLWIFFTYCKLKAITVFPKPGKDIHQQWEVRKTKYWYHKQICWWNSSSIVFLYLFILLSQIHSLISFVLWQKINWCVRKYNTSALRIKESIFIQVRYSYSLVKLWNEHGFVYVSHFRFYAGVKLT